VVWSWSIRLRNEASNTVTLETCRSAMTAQGGALRSAWLRAPPQNRRAIFPMCYGPEFAGRMLDQFGASDENAAGGRAATPVDTATTSSSVPAAIIMVALRRYRHPPIPVAAATAGYGCSVAVARSMPAPGSHARGAPHQPRSRSVSPIRSARRGDRRCAVCEPQCAPTRELSTSNAS
jgi:hypothetical protein